jgi:hypothetical protein
MVARESQRQLHPEIARSRLRIAISVEESAGGIGALGDTRNRDPAPTRSYHVPARVFGWIGIGHTTCLAFEQPKVDGLVFIGSANIRHSEGHGHASVIVARFIESHGVSGTTVARASKSRSIANAAIAWAIVFRASAALTQGGHKQYPNKSY